MKRSEVIQFCANLEATLDECLFGEKKKSDQSSGTAKAVAEGAAVGAAGAGAVAAHRAVLRNYGGEGGVRQAYSNLGRNVAREVSEPVAGAVLRGKRAYGIAREVGGLGRLGAAGRGLKKGLNPALAKLRRVAAAVK
jgi:hypothetical protein